MDQDESPKSHDVEAAKSFVSNQGRKQNDGQPDPFLLETIYPIATNLFAPTGIVAASNKNVIVAFDTNVLLLPYSLKQDQLSSLSTLYRQLAADSRLFVPARCVREFIKNRDGNLADVIAGINTKKSQINLPEARISPLMEGIEGYQELLLAHEELKSAKQKYLSSLDAIIKKMRSWRSDDHLTSLYNEVFTNDRIIDHSEDNAELISIWKYRLINKILPGFKDSTKDDTGIGDFII
jgi:rRNA-processing protein FCF1